MAKVDPRARGSKRLGRALLIVAAGAVVLTGCGGSNTLLSGSSSQSNSSITSDSSSDSSGSSSSSSSSNRSSRSSNSGSLSAQQLVLRSSDVPGGYRSRSSDSSTSSDASGTRYAQVIFQNGDDTSRISNEVSVSSSASIAVSVYTHLLHTVSSLTEQPSSSIGDGIGEEAQVFTGTTNDGSQPITAIVWRRGLATSGLGVAGATSQGELRRMAQAIDNRIKGGN